MTHLSGGATLHSYYSSLQLQAPILGMAQRFREMIMLGYLFKTKKLVIRRIASLQTASFLLFPIVQLASILFIE